MKLKMNFGIPFLILLFYLPARAQSNKLNNSSVQNVDSAVWIIKNRSIPPPAAASELLRNSVISMPQPDYNAQQYVPKNDSEWKALQNTVDMEMMGYVAEMI